MTFINIPPIAVLADSVRAAFRAEMPGSDATAWPNNLNPTAKVLAGCLWTLYLRLDYVAQQMFAASAEGIWLDRHATEYGMARLASTQASGRITVVAAGPASLAAQTILVSTSGQRYRVLAGVSLASGGVLGVVVMAMAAGSAGNLDAGTSLSVVGDGAVGVMTYTVAAGGLTGGTDSENDEGLRARVLFRKRYPPQGGAASDYISWAQEVNGITRCFIERLWNGPGTIRVFPVADGPLTNGIPTQALLDAVRQVMAQSAPIGAVVTVQAPRAYPIDVGITGLYPDTPAIREAVRVELTATFLRVARVAGSDVVTSGLPFLATAQSFSRSWIWQAIANAAGEERHSLTSPAADVVVPAGALPVLGQLSFG